MTNCPTCLELGAATRCPRVLQEHVAQEYHLLERRVCWVGFKFVLGRLAVFWHNVPQLAWWAMTKLTSA